MSFRIIYLSSISTICKFKQFMRMHYTLCYIDQERIESYGDTRTMERQSYSDNVLCIVRLVYPLDPVV